MESREYVAVKDLKPGDVVVDNPHITYVVKAISPRAFDWFHVEWEESGTEKESFSNLRGDWKLSIRK